VSQLLIYIIKFYQLALSPYFGNQCRFTPTCSMYTIEALNKFGFFKGSWLGFKRILRCNPKCSGGHDPVPLK
jgi:putative membrane protein insertion efficiency factor